MNFPSGLSEDSCLVLIVYCEDLDAEEISGVVGIVANVGCAVVEVAANACSAVVA